MPKNKNQKPIVAEPQKEEQDKKVFFTGLLNKERKYFLENLSVLIAAGIDMVSALKSIEEETDSRRMKKIVGNILNRVETGEALWKALMSTSIFPNRVISFIRVGEESGHLPENLDIIISQLNKEWELASKIRSAMLYPAIVLPLTFFVGLGTAWFTLPRLAEVFAQINAPLPFLTRVLLEVGVFLSKYGIVVIPLIATVFLSIVYFLFSFPKTKALGYILMSRAPVIKELIQFVELSRMGYMMNDLLSAGISVVEAFGSLAEATTFRNFGNYYLYLQESLKNGNSFRKSFAANPKSKRYIPGYVQNLIVSAEQSGKLTETFRKIGGIYELKTESTVRNASGIVEPVLLIVIGLVVGAVALAVMMPMYSLVQNF